MEGDMLFMRRVSNLMKITRESKNPSLKDLWQKKLDQLVEKDKHEKMVERARSVH